MRETATHENPSGAANERYTVERASRHGRLHVWQHNRGLSADCEAHATGERCFSFGTYMTLDALEQAFVEHAAEAEGVCWACSQPEDGWPNRERCRRCWLIYHARVERVMPRDCPPFPGDSGSGKRLADAHGNGRNRDV